MKRSLYGSILLLACLLLVSFQVGAQTRAVAARSTDLFYGPDQSWQQFFSGSGGPSGPSCGPSVPTPIDEASAAWLACLSAHGDLALQTECPGAPSGVWQFSNLRPEYPPVLPGGASPPFALIVDYVVAPFETVDCISHGWQVSGVSLLGSLLEVTCADGSTPVAGNCPLDLSIEDKDKSTGTPKDCRAVAGNPCNVANGNKFQVETDYVGAGTFPLVLQRFHNAQKPAALKSSRFGAAWTHSYAGSVQLMASGSLFTAYVMRPDGKALYFNSATSEGPWTGDGDVSHALVQIVQGGMPKWQLTSSDGDLTEVYDLRTGRLESITNRAGLPQTLQYDSNSRLQSVSDAFGRTLTFSYGADGRIASVTDPALNQITYQYDPAQGNLLSVTYPGSPTATRSYSYGNATFPHALTAIVDENSATHATWDYDGSGRALSSQRAGGAAHVTFAYPTASATEVTAYVDPSLSAIRTYNFEVSLAIKRLTSITGPACPSCGPASQTFDPNANVASQTDWNGNRTNYTYDLARNLEISRTEGLTAAGGTTPQMRTISTQWHATFRLPTAIAEPLRITTNAYDPDGTQCGARGALCSKTVQATTDANGSTGFSATPSGAPRTWTYTYNTNGSVLTINGPRTDVSDVTTYTYYANNDADPAKRGHVGTVTNAAGHLTSITAYNAHGQPLTMVNPNGLTTTMTYDARQRLKTRTVGSELTSYDYDGVEQLTKVTLPDGSFLSYTYDAAHRLTDIQDNLGNRISYTLDAMSNRTQEQVFDPANQLAQTRSRVFNNLNRLFRELGAQSQTTEYAYDDQGNVISVKDPLNRITSNQYDALNRLKQVASPAPISAVTQYAYNGLDALTSVTDPRSLVTGYTVDGLGNLNVQTSPDTGTTTNTYDAAGNLLTQTDAKSQTTTYAYDALNRVTLITFHDGSKQAYAYDQGANGIGRLSSITETNPANQVTSVIAYAYDPHGRVTSETRTVAGVQYVLAYRYDSSGRLDQLTYPSGRAVNYAFDGLGRVNAVTTTKPGQQAQNVVTSVTHHPFGSVKSYTLGNGQVYTRGIDLDGRIASYTLGAQSFAIGYDAASRISFISDVANPPNTNTYGYDELDRLTGAVLPGTPYAYSYDAAGNRTSRTAGSSTDNYAYGGTSNRIASITPTSGAVRNFVFDPNGSTTADGVNTYAYDTRGRMVQATSTIGATNYQVNSLGQRIRKTNAQTDRVFHYDTRGRLIAESDPAGGFKRELFYLGDIPVGVVQ